MISMASPTLILTIFTSAILVVSAAAVAATRWCVPRAQDTAEGDVELAELSATLPGGAPEHMIPAGGVPPLTTTHQNGAPPRARRKFRDVPPIRGVGVVSHVQR